MNTRTIKSPENVRIQDFFLYFVCQKSSDINSRIKEKTVCPHTVTHITIVSSGQDSAKGHLSVAKSQKFEKPSGNSL